MQIMIINPDYGMTDAEIRERLSILRQAVPKDVELRMECLSESAVYLDSMADAALAAPEILRMARRAEKDGFDAVVLYCFSDPAIDACRELLEIPVIGAGQSACLCVVTVARQFGIIVADAARIPEKRLFLNVCGVDSCRIVGLRGVDLRGRFPREDLPFTLDRLEAAGRRLVEEDGAQAVVLGCLSFLGMADALAVRLGVPVIDPALVAVTTAEMVARLKLKTSKRAYPTPPRGVRTLIASAVEIP